MASVGIVGGGIVGSAIAVWLLADGHEVTVFERNPDGRFASSGNAGLVVLPQFSPLARPGVVRQVPGWLVDPLGPLSIRWRDFPALIPWLTRFVASASPQQTRRATAALAWLMSTALADHQELARRANLPFYLRHTGALHVYRTPHSFHLGMVEWKERLEYGVKIEEMTPDEVRTLAPALRGEFFRAVLAPDHWTATSPLAILLGLRQRIVSAGGRFETAQIDAVAPQADAIAIAAGGTTRRFDRAVIAAGVWSRDLVRRLGLKVQLETERGYNTTWAKPPVDIPLPMFFDDSFVASPLDDGLRVGGAVELAAVDARPNFARAAALRSRMRRFVPDLPDAGGIEWMGERPSTPDSLPVISITPKEPRIAMAFGHGHLGLTFSAATARHIARLVAGQPPDPQLQSFSIARFQ